jgi:SAM-dependent methyltransferase
MAIGKYNTYPEILDRMKTGDQIFLDLGCAFAQDIRRLVADGVDSSKCYGSDLRLDFIGLGYELFCDKETLKSEFIAADIFDADSALKELYGKVDIIGSSSFFHLFDWEQQKQVAHRCAKLLKPQKGSMIVGRQVGSREPGIRVRPNERGSRYRHDAKTWRKFWAEVGEEVGMQFHVEAEEIELPQHLTRGAGWDIGLVFTVKLV